MKMEIKLQSAVLPHSVPEGQQSGIYQRILPQRSEQQGKKFPCTGVGGRGESSSNEN